MDISVILLFVTIVQSVSSVQWKVGCPKDCVCELREKSQLQTADCSNRKLRSVPEDLPVDTERLLLRGNAITSVEDQKLFRYPKLQDLDLSYNLIQEIPSNSAFSNLSSLHTLNLQKNRLYTLKNGTFSNLINLQQLSLDGNGITVIQKSAFSGLKDLQKLSMKDNNLSQVLSEWFTSMPVLDSLSLDNNGIGELQGGVFHSLDKLSLLSLEGNKLTSLPKLAFQGLERLQKLILDSNLFQSVPTGALQLLRSLKILSLEANPIIELAPESFKKLSIAEVSLNNLPQLQVIDRHSFVDMPHMAILQLHDNHRLTFIHPEAFLNVPKLRVLYVHNNNLMTLPQELVTSLPGLTNVTFYHNPIRCDCNSYWIKQQIDTVHRQPTLATNASTAQSSAASNPVQTMVANSTLRLITFPEASKLACDLPVKYGSRLLLNLLLANIPTLCPPTVVAFFNESYQRQLGSSISLRCRAIGVPSPNIHWIMSNGKIVNYTSNYSRVKLDLTGTLTINHLKAIDAGTYTCVATNSYKKGSDTSSTVLKVHSNNVNIFYTGIATDFITISWNGTDSTMSTSDYLMLYRRVDSDKAYGKIDLRPYMRQYAITNLKPATFYEFCIAYQNKADFVKLNCMTVQTMQRSYRMAGIHTFGSMSLVIAVMSAFAFIVFFCMGIALLKRYFRRKAYKEPEGPIRPTTPKKLETMSHIPLDNLYAPPSTPICSSRTSLITA